jgi:hypothetical protein
MTLLLIGLFQFFEYLLFIVVGIVIVYIVARLASLAYFNSKKDFYKGLKNLKSKMHFKDKVL